MVKKKIDLADIKENDLEKTSSFIDLMSRSERKKRDKIKEKDNVEKEQTQENNEIDIEDMVSEKRKNTSDLTKQLEEAKKSYNNTYKQDDDSLGRTQILELTRQMKFNLEETKEENQNKKKKGFSPLNVIGEINLLCIGYYIYLLVFTNFQDDQNNYMISGAIIVLLVLLFGLAVVTSKKFSKLFRVLNVLTILGFVLFHIYTLIN